MLNKLLQITETRYAELAMLENRNKLLKHENQVLIAQLESLLEEIRKLKKKYEKTA
jgi:vacuolar-type H+-ATPase subunit D/Vma8